MMDIATAFNKYSFLGSEFLLWLWWASEIDVDTISKEAGNKGGTTFSLGKSIVIENNGSDISKKCKLSITGSGNKEAMSALREGGTIKEINFTCTIGENEDEFSMTINSDDLSLKAFKTPTIGVSREQDEIEGAILEKTYLGRIVFDCLDRLFLFYLDSKISMDWDDDILHEVRKWLVGE